MKNKTKKYLFLFLFFCFINTFSQFIYREEFSVPMSILGINIENPWTGGHTSGQFYRINLNGSGQEDLVVFDKISSRIYTYIHNGSGFSYDPRYISFFPPIVNWLSIVDYDCDGKKDIFTGCSTPSLDIYINVYRNTTSLLTIPSWTISADKLLFEGGDIQNLKVTIPRTETPSVVDIDDDGDIDIIVYDALSGDALNFYRNRSKDKFNDCTHLDFERYISCWGKFKVTSSCGNLISPLVSCTGFNAKNQMREEHAGGTAITIFDLNGDGKKDILLGDISCTNLVALTNSGTNLSAMMQLANSYYPAQYPVTVPVLPMVSIEDIDGDNLKDMIVTSEAAPFTYNSDFSKSIQFYKNIGNTTLPSFQFQQNDFLQNKTLDLGYYLYPSLIDIDADGDLDIICGTPKKPQPSGLNYATLILIRNIGTKLLPKFNVENLDYLGMSSLNYQLIRPAFVDINNDKKLDIYFITREASNVKRIKYILNTGETNQASSYPITNIQTISNISVNELDTPIFHDISADGLVDLLHIKFNSGPINYYKNTGTAISPDFALQRYINPPSTIPSSLFGGLDFDLDFKNYSGTIVKLKSTDSPVLITSDAFGKVRMYPNFINEQNEFITKDTFSLLNTLDSLTYPFRLSANSAFAAGDLYADSTTTFIVGEAGGGLRMFVNKDSKPIQIIPTYVGINAKKPAHKPISIYPNPAHESVFLDTDIENLQIDFYTSLGVLTKKQNQIAYKAHSEIKLNDLQSGIYFLVIQYDGFVFRYKLVKY